MYYVDVDHETAAPFCVLALADARDKALFFILHKRALAQRLNMGSVLVDLLYYAARERDELLLAYIANPVEMAQSRIELANDCIVKYRDNATWWWLREQHRFLSAARCACGAWLKQGEGPSCAAHAAEQYELITLDLVCGRMHHSTVLDA
jgi:hypothetical protein